MDNGGNPVAKLLAANACVACHSAEQRLVGPSFREIAARYAGEPDAAARLAQKVKQGGAGTWGSVPMPPNAGIPDAELGQILIGEAPGRTSPDEITIFESQGLAIEDLASAQFLHRRALETGAGARARF